MHPIDFLYTHATHIFYDEIIHRSSVPADICGVCLRPSKKWIKPDMAVDFHGYFREVHCLACHTLFHPSENYLGIEQFRGAKKVPVFNKLSMLSGCGLLVTPKRTILFANKYYDKLIEAKNFPWELVRLNKGEMSHHRIMDYQDIIQESIIIGKFNRKKEELVAHLTYSNHRTFNICDDSSIKEIDVDSYNELNRVLRTKNKKDIVKWRSCVKALSLGMKKPKDKTITDFWASHRDLQRATNRMPLNPHSRLFMLSMLGA